MLTGNHIFTSGSPGTNAAAIREAKVTLEEPVRGSRKVPRVNIHTLIDSFVAHRKKHADKQPKESDDKGGGRGMFGWFGGEKKDKSPSKAKKDKEAEVPEGTDRRELYKSQYRAIYTYKMSAAEPPRVEWRSPITTFLFYLPIP